jgi:hypothetical protein
MPPTTCHVCLEPLDDHERRKRGEHIRLAKRLQGVSAEKTRMPQSWKRYGA